MCTFQKMINISVGQFRFFYKVNTLIGVNFSTFGVKSQTRMHLHVLISCKTLWNHGWWWVAVTDFNSAKKKKKDSTKLLDGVLFLSMELICYAKMNCSCLC